MSLIKLSNGVEISEDTIVAALEKAGIETKPPEPKHIFEAGDVAKSEGEWRIIIKVKGELQSFTTDGYYINGGQTKFEQFNYQFVGKLENLLK